MSEYSGFDRKQKSKEEREFVQDFCGSLGKGMLAKANFETLGRSSGLTPLGFDGDACSGMMDRGCSGVGFSTTEQTEDTEILKNSSGLSPLRPSGEKSFGLTPLNFDSEPQMNADERRCGCISIENDTEKNSPERIRTQIPVTSNFAIFAPFAVKVTKESDLNDR